MVYVFRGFRVFRVFRGFRDFRGFRGFFVSILLIFVFTFFTLFPWAFARFPRPIAHIFTLPIFSTFDRFHTAKLCVNMKADHWNHENGEHENMKAEICLFLLRRQPHAQFHGCNLTLLVRTGANNIQINMLRR